MRIFMVVLGMSLAMQGGCEMFMFVDATPPEIPTITSEELHVRQENGEKIVLLDVREENEYLDFHIPNAHWFPKSKFDRDDLTLLAHLKTFDPGSVFVAYCGAGHRSSYVTRRLREAGHNAYNLDGISFWERKRYPVIRGPKLPASMEPAPIQLREAYEHYYLLFKDVVWVDTRSHKAYKAGHIRRAISIPLSKLRDNLAKIPRNKEIVLYCEDIWDDGKYTAGTSAGRILLKNGYKHERIKVFEDGYGAWRHAGYPVTSWLRSKRCCGQKKSFDTFGEGT